MRYLAFMTMLAAVLALVGCLPPESGPAAGKPWVSAAGNLNNLNVVTVADVAGTTGFRFWQRDAAGTWHSGGVGQGEPAAIAAWREYLVVFFPSGRYGLFGPGRPDIQPSPLPSWTPAAACENDLGMDVFGWDTAGEPVHARYADGKWAWRRIEVAMERKKVLDPCAIRFGGRLFVLWREEVPTLTNSPVNDRMQFIYLDEKGHWVGPIPSRVHVASAPHVASNGAAMVCLFLKPASADEPPKWTLATYATTDEDWHEAAPVSGTPPVNGPVALARQGERFCAVTLTDTGPQVAPLDVPSGKLGEFVPLASTGEARPEAGADNRAAILLLLSALTLMLLVILWNRSRGAAAAAKAAERGGPAADRPPRSAAESVRPAGSVPSLVPAPLVRRLAAFAVDYVLLTLGMMPFAPAFPPDALIRVLHGDQVILHEMMVFSLIFQALILAYFTVAEGAFGQTVGKRLLGIEVQSEAGGPITWWQALLRNALRLIDQLPVFYILGIASILIGPKPQRLGDRVARTLVVMRLSKDAKQ